jgi:hypothetical protein
MARGIQKGSEAGSAESKQLDGDVKMVAEAMAQYLRVQNNQQYFYEFGHQNYSGANYSHRTITENALPELVQRGVTIGCVPDGGMWFDGARNQSRTLRVAFEAKHQQDGGNAIERWSKNYLVCYRLNPDVRYVTFMTGQGARTGGVLHKFGESMRAMNGDNCVFYYEPQGFSPEGICNIMACTLGLAVTFDQIKPYLAQKITNNFVQLFETETAEQRAARLAESEQRNRAELAFSQFSQDPTDPLYPVWHRLPREHRVEAHDIVVDMLQQQHANSVIASELVRCFLD